VLSSVKDGTIIEENHIIIIIYNLLCALNFMHSANLIHRDIKPANILIDGKCQVRICDFGFARSMPKIKTNAYSFT
jgi:serine/threonine protein kinase